MRLKIQGSIKFIIPIEIFVEIDNKPEYIRTQMVSVLSQVAPEPLQCFTEGPTNV